MAELGLGPDLLQHLLPTQPCEIEPPQAEACTLYVDSEGHITTPDDAAQAQGIGIIHASDVVFSDGSAFEGQWPSLSRVGWGVAIVDLGTGQLRWGMCGNLPRAAPQTAPAAELYAILQIVEHAQEGALAIFADCKMVTDASECGTTSAAASRGPFSAWWRDIIEANGGRAPSVRKVKAHVTVDASASAIDARDAAANNWADVLAKRGASMHRVAEPFRVRREKAWALYRQLAKCAALALDLWPAPRELLRGETGKRRLRRQRLDAARRLAAAPDGRQWRWAGSRYWVCINCCRRTTDTRGIRGTGRCTTMPPAIKAALTQGAQLGHSLHVALVLCDEHPLYFCTLCGAYSEYAPRKLAEPCRNRLNRGAQDKLRRIAKHIHPHSKAGLGPIWRVAYFPEVRSAPSPGAGRRSDAVLGALDAADGGDDGFAEWARGQAEAEGHECNETRASEEHQEGGNWIC